MPNSHQFFLFCFFFFCFRCQLILLFFFFPPFIYFPFLTFKSLLLSLFCSFHLQYSLHLFPLLSFSLQFFNLHFPPFFYFSPHIFAVSIITLSISIYFHFLLRLIIFHIQNLFTFIRIIFPYSPLLPLDLLSIYHHLSLYYFPLLSFSFSHPFSYLPWILFQILVLTGSKLLWPCLSLLEEQKSLFNVDIIRYRCQKISSRGKIRIKHSDFLGRVTGYPKLTDGCKTVVLGSFSFSHFDLVFSLRVNLEK